MRCAQYATGSSKIRSRSSGGDMNVPSARRWSDGRNEGKVSLGGEGSGP